jgi:hypothetical protein
MSKAAAIAVVAGGAALALQGGETVPPESRADIRKRIFAPIFNRTGGVYEGTPDPKYAPRSPFTGTNESSWPQEVIDAAMAALRKKWDELSGPARREACEALKKQFPDDPAVQQLDCGKASLQAALIAVGAALAVTCMACSAVVIIAVVVFGDQFEQILSDAWKQLSGDAFSGGSEEGKERICLGLITEGRYGMFTAEDFGGQEGVARYCHDVIYGLKA